MKSPRSARPRALRLAAVLLLALPAAAQADCAGRAEPLAHGGRLNVRLDNDLFAGVGRDGGYTNGFQLTHVSRDLRDAREADCLPWPARPLHRLLGWLQPEGSDEKHALGGIGLALFTPSEHEASGMMPADRPYAAALLLGVGYSARSGDQLRSSQLRVGMVGRSVRGEQIQNGIHTLVGSEKWRGWDSQLHDEPVFQLMHERLQRWGARALPAALATDVIAHWGGSIGTWQTYANVGAEWRVGRNLPRNFGSDPLRPGGYGAPAVQPAPGDETSGVHLFASVDLRAVLRNITLDGNTWRDSARVDKRGFVVDFGVGISVARRDWTLTFARYIRSREFAGQKDRPVFGSLALSHAL